MTDDTHATRLPTVRTRRRSSVNPPAADLQADFEQRSASVLPDAEAIVQRTASPRLTDTAATRPPDYEIGYRKPPRHSQFKPGQSGNPKGRPKQARGLNTIILKHMLTSVQIKTAQGIERVSMIEALFLKALDSGSRGEFRAIEKLLAMYAAAVPEVSEVSGPPPLADPVALSAADEEILERLRAEVAAELQSAGGAESSHVPEGDCGDA